VDRIAACPHLPPELAEPGALAALGEERGAAFYLTALRRAQALWRDDKPAQAILRLDRAWAADLAGEEEVLARWPSPFRALDWMLVRREGAGFLGNPVRHFQHLATRMHAVRREARVWRAWAAFHLAERRLEGFPRDEEQIERERVRVPEPGEVREGLEREGWRGEAELWCLVIGLW